MPVLHSTSRSGVLSSPTGPGVTSDAAKLQHSVEVLRWKRVRNSGEFSSRMVHRACSHTGYFAGRRYLKHNIKFLIIDSFLEDSLCAPGSPLLRSKAAAWQLAS